MFSVPCALQMRALHHHLRPHTEEETVYLQMLVWKQNAEFPFSNEEHYEQTPFFSPRKQIHFSVL